MIRASTICSKRAIEFFTAFPPMGLLPIKPAEVLLSYTGPDRSMPRWPTGREHRTDASPVRGGIT